MKKMLKVKRNHLKKQSLVFKVLYLITIFDGLSYKQLKNKLKDVSHYRLKNALKELLYPVKFICLDTGKETVFLNEIELDQRTNKFIRIFSKGETFEMDETVFKKLDSDSLKLYSVIVSGSGQLKKLSGLSQTAFDKSLRLLLFKKYISVETYAKHIGRNEKNLLNKALKSDKKMGLATSIVRKYHSELTSHRVLKSLKNQHNSGKIKDGLSNTAGSRGASYEV